MAWDVLRFCAWYGMVGPRPLRITRLVTCLHSGVVHVKSARMHPSGGICDQSRPTIQPDSEDPSLRKIFSGLRPYFALLMCSFGGQAQPVPDALLGNTGSVSQVTGPGSLENCVCDSAGSHTRSRGVAGVLLFHAHHRRGEDGGVFF